MQTMDENSKLLRVSKSLFKGLRLVLFGDFREPVPLDRYSRIRSAKETSKEALLLEIKNSSDRIKLAKQQGNDELAQQALEHQRQCVEELGDIDAAHQIIRRTEFEDKNKNLIKLHGLVWNFLLPPKSYPSPRFTEAATKVMDLAKQESRRMGHNFIGTEQILAGLLIEEQGIAARSLFLLGANIDGVRAETTKIIGSGSGYLSEHCPFTPRAKRLMDLAEVEANQLTSKPIDTEHLLLGLVRDGEGVAQRVLQNLGLDIKQIRVVVMRMISEKAKA
jgi:hypothetical protein